jgi:hypothetical protein
MEFVTVVGAEGYDPIRRMPPGGHGRWARLMSCVAPASPPPISHLIRRMYPRSL